MPTEYTRVTVETSIQAPIAEVWKCWTEPEHIVQWNKASDDWCCPRAENHLEVGGTFSYRMEACDGSFGFDFGGTYTEVVPHERMVSLLGDGRRVEVTFKQEGDMVHMVETFDAEQTNPVELQRKGWQAILDSFKKEVISKRQ